MAISGDLLPRRAGIIRDWQNNPQSETFVLLLSLAQSASGWECVLKPLLLVISSDIIIGNLLFISMSHIYIYIHCIYICIYIYTRCIYIYINLNSNLNLILCQSITSLFFWLKVSLLVGYTPIFVAVLLGQHLGGTNLTAASHVVFLHPMLAPNAERAVGYEMQERRKMVTTTLW
jgi:hypothetical protein